MKIERLQAATLAESVEPGQVVVVYGPRRSGKTTLVKDFLQDYSGKYLFLNADELRPRELLGSQDASVFAELLAHNDLLVIDEAQRVPEIGLNLKIIVDTFPHVKVIATGSASFELANNIAEPLTGRKTTLTLYPIAFAELLQTLGTFAVKEDLERWLLWGGYPQIVTEESARKRTKILDEIVGSYLYKDILELNEIKRADKLVDLLRLLAFQIGHEVSLTELGSALALNRNTVERYLDLLEKVFVIFRVSGFSRNLRKEIAKTHRYYFFDNGVRNSLIQNFNPLALRNDVGQLWENYLVSERRKATHYSGKTASSYFWRTYDQKEIDLMEEAAGTLAGFEFKWGKPDISKATQQEFLTTYPGASLEVINKENFIDFLRVGGYSKPA